MVKLSTIRVWTCSAACLAMVLAFAGIAAAQNEQDQSNRDQDREQQSDQSDRERDSDRDEQDRDRDQQNRQREEQEREREQQERQRQQQDQQRDQQNRQTQWDETRSRQSNQRDSNWPQPTQYGRGQQTQYDSFGQRQSGQFGGQRDQDAGLGVNIVSDGGQGVLVTQVHPGSPAQEMGLRRNDRITHLNGQQVSSDQQFISRIRNMNPGDEVELEVLRNRDERIVRGELESRREALVLSNRRQSGQPWQQGNENWQTGYQEGGYSSQQQGRTAGGADFNSRINSIEQQVDRLSRELEQVRYALQDLRQGGQTGQMSRLQRSGETQAGYDEFQSGRYQDGRTIIRDGGQGQRFQDSGQSGDFRRSFDGGTDSEGGVTGGLRTRPDNDQNWSNRQ